MTSSGDQSDSSDDGGSGFADQIADLDVDVQAGDDKDEDSEESEAPESARRDDEELFTEAIENLDDEQIRRAKYDGAEDEREESGDEETGDEQNESRGQSTPHAESAEDNRLGEQLGDLEVERDELPEGSRPERFSDGQTRDSADREQQKERSSRQTFEEAIEGLSPEEMRRQKFDAEADGDESSPKPREASKGQADQTSEGKNEEREEAQRQELERRRRERKFEQAMRDVDQMDKDGKKHRNPSAPDPSMFFEDDGPTRTSDDFVTPTLAKSGESLNHIPPLDETQKSMIERFEEVERRGDIAELNLRGETADEAKNLLRAFIERCRREDREFARIIPGRGKESDHEPVLKPVVLEWLETTGVDVIRGYAPERQFGGDYGSIIVEFRHE